MNIIVDSRAHVYFSCGQKRLIKRNCEVFEDKMESVAAEASGEENEENGQKKKQRKTKR